MKWLSEWCSWIQDYLGEEFGYEVEKWQVLTVVLLCVLIALGGLIIYGRGALAERSPVKEVKKQAGKKRPSEEVVVHVCGAVQKPGVCSLRGGSRVIDAIGAAGGAVPDADLSRLNLAKPLSDGERIYVARVGESVPATQPASLTAGAKININTASPEELDALPGVGKAIAERIVAYRDKHGRFERIEQLEEIEGIGPRKYEELKDRVTV